MAYACLQKIILDRPPHQIVADGRLGDLLVLLDRFVVIVVNGCEVRNLQEQFIRESATPRSSSAFYCILSNPVNPHNMDE